MLETKKLFISYRSSDAVKVDKIARDLELLQYEDGIARYKAWQDKHNLPPASPNWWDAIVDAIIDCDVFVFNMSKASLQSEVCQAELDYANKRNRPIIPVVLEGEFFLDPSSGKYNINYWDLVPHWLRDVQFIFYVGADFYSSFQTAIDLFERNWPRDIDVKRPMNPDSNSTHGSNHALYDIACDYAERLAFTEAEKHFGALVRRNDSDYADVAAEWLEILSLYAELIEIDERRSARFIFKSKWEAYQALFPKIFLDDIFDPQDFITRIVDTTPMTIKSSLKPVQTSKVQAKPDTAIPSIQSKSLRLMPAPFDWIDIPGKGYSISKYPVTNEQFRKFIKVGGYKTERWWTQLGWKARKEGLGLLYDYDNGTWKSLAKPWVEPFYWRDSEFNSNIQPVCVTWHEAVAFCLWLSEASGEDIILPTEDQWQYAAQGDDNRMYPWGNNWNRDLCNNNHEGKGIQKTSPVTQYEDKGDSPFGVVDMAGNILEWCSTDADRETNNIHDKSDNRVIRGGSWNERSPSHFQCDFSVAADPLRRQDNGVGFRLARS